MAVKKNIITIVGCGPGGADYLTVIARREIDRAEVLVGAPRLLDAFPESPARRIPIGADIARALDRIALWRARRIVVLATGDPGLCSIAQPVIRRFGRQACRVIPGISAVQAAFAAIGADWLDARIVSAHCRKPAMDHSALQGAAKIAVLAGNRAAGEWLADLARILGRAYDIFVCSDLTLPGESVRPIRGPTLRKAILPSRSVVLFIRKTEESQSKRDLGSDRQSRSLECAGLTALSAIRRQVKAASSRRTPKARGARQRGHKNLPPENNLLDMNNAETIK